MRKEDLHKTETFKVMETVTSRAASMLNNVLNAGSEYGTIGEPDSPMAFVVLVADFREGSPTGGIVSASANLTREGANDLLEAILSENGFVEYDPDKAVH